METIKRYSRRIKKELKKQMLSTIDGAWRSKDIRITSVERYSRYSVRNATFKGLTVIGYTLGY